jgi:hypothetical protein
LAWALLLITSFKLSLAALALALSLLLPLLLEAEEVGFSLSLPSLLSFVIILPLSLVGISPSNLVYFFQLPP